MQRMNVGVVLRPRSSSDPLNPLRFLRLRKIDDLLKDKGKLEEDKNESDDKDENKESEDSNQNVKKRPRHAEIGGQRMLIRLSRKRIERRGGIEECRHRRRKN
jgi:hypothetical protein